MDSIAKIIAAGLPDVSSALKLVREAPGTSERVLSWRLPAVGRQPTPHSRLRIGRESDNDQRPSASTTLNKLSVLMPVQNDRWTLREAVARVLAAPVPLETELVVVDDASTDGSWNLISELSAADPRIRAVRHPEPRGQGAAIRTAIEHMSGDVAVLQNADLDYDPSQYGHLLNPILQGNADAVFGSRFTGPARRVLGFWEGLSNRLLTLGSNVLWNLSLTDAQTSCRMVRADLLKQLHLTSDTPALGAEMTCRLAQSGARIYEVPISDSGRKSPRRKRTRLIDALRALGQAFRCKWLQTQFTKHSGHYVLSAVSRATGYNRWALRLAEDYMGQRVLEAGCGIGNLSTLLLDRQRLVLVDYEPVYVAALRRRFACHENVRIDQADLTDSAKYARWKAEHLDTIVCSNVLEHLDDDDEVLRRFRETLVPGGHCVIVVPAGEWLYNGMDQELGHRRRYTRMELFGKMAAAGFDVVFSRQFCRLGALSWAISGRLLRRRHLSPRQMIWFDRMLPLVKLLDRLLPVPGMSLVMVGRKPRRSARRMAA